MRKFAKQIDDSNKNENNMQFLGCLWIIGKFGNSQMIEDFINQKTYLWKKDDFLARQVACLYPRIKSKSTQNSLTNMIRAFGLTNANSVLENYQLISQNEDIVKYKVKNYITATNKNGIYPLPKLLIALSVLSGNLSYDLTHSIQQQLLNKISCKVCKYYIKVID